MDLRRATALSLAKAIKTKEIGIEELTRAYLTRIRRIDGKHGLNAVVRIDPRAIKQARAMDRQVADCDLPLFGLPVLVKENIDLKGLPTTAGSRALKDNIAVADAPVVANLRKCGALILGKTNMTEFANYTTQDMPGGYSSLGGQVYSAYGRDKDASGSSTGSAVAVSAGLCAAAVGTDTSFSVVGCATNHGVTGLKPPHGALSQQGILPISHTLDSAGCLTRDFADALALYYGMKGAVQPSIAPIAISKLRLAINDYNRRVVSEQQNGYYEAIFDQLKSSGATLEMVTHPYSDALSAIMRCEFMHDLEAYLAGTNAKRKTLHSIVAFYEAHPQIMMKYGDTCLRDALDKATGKLDDESYLSAMQQRSTLSVAIKDSCANYDACIMTGPTNVMHLIGIPSVALPMGMGKDGAPRGMIMYGADESRLYAAALALEPFMQPIEPPPEAM